MKSKALLLIVLLTFVGNVFFNANGVRALSILAPTVFGIQVDEIITYGELNVYKSKEGPKFILGPIGTDRQLKIYDSHGEDTASYKPGDEKAHDPTTLKLESTSENIVVCLYHYSQQKCGTKVEGTRDYAGNRFQMKLSNELQEVENILIEVYAKRVGSAEAIQQLETFGLGEYGRYVKLENPEEHKETIEQFEILSQIDGKRFTIKGSLFLAPAHFGASGVNDSFGNSPIIYSLKILYLVLACLLFLITTILLLVRRGRLSKGGKVVTIGFLTVSIIMLVFYIILNWFFGIQIF